MDSLRKISFEPLKALLVDFDNTLYDYTPCHQAALIAVYQLYITRYAQCSYDDFLLEYRQSQKQVKLYTKNQAASHSRFLYFQKMLEKRGGGTSVEFTMALEERYWSSFEKAIVLKQDVIDFLVEAKQKGLKICLITDLTASVQFRKMTAIGVCSLVDFVVTSEEAGVEKPHETIFSLALEKLNASKDEVVMIGDDAIKDIHGANNFGIKAYLV